MAEEKFLEGQTGTFTVLMTIKKPFAIVTRSYGPFTKTRARSLENKLKKQYANDESVIHFEVSQLWTAAWWDGKGKDREEALATSDTLSELNKQFDTAETVKEKVAILNKAKELWG